MTKINFITAGDLDEATIGESIWLPTARQAQPGILLGIHQESLRRTGTTERVEVVVLRIGTMRVTAPESGATYRSVQYVMKPHAPVALGVATETVSTIWADEQGPTGATLSTWAVRDFASAEDLALRGSVAPLEPHINADWDTLMGTDDDDSF